MIVVLFDVDGTLTESGKKIGSEMKKVICEISSVPNLRLGIVGGGDYAKICWQLSDCLEKFHYIFSECGAVAYVGGIKVIDKNMLDYCDRNSLNVINFFS